MHIPMQYINTLIIKHQYIHYYIINTYINTSTCTYTLIHQYIHVHILHLYSMQGIIQRGGREFPYLYQIFTSACMCIKLLINDPCFSHSLPPSVYGNTSTISTEQYSPYLQKNIIKLKYMLLA